MKIEHRNGIVVVTLPKGGEKMASVSPTPPLLIEPWTEAWDQQTVNKMQKMQNGMDQLTQDLLSELPNPPAIIHPFSFGSTVNLEDQKDQYVVHFYLPDRDLSTAKAEIVGNQLRVTATDLSAKETTSQFSSSSEYSSGEYTEMITLPGPVHADQMKVERKKGTLTVTVPKA